MTTELMVNAKDGKEKKHIKMHNYLKFMENTLKLTILKDHLDKVIQK